MNIRDEFFVIDSRNLDAVSVSRMYGFAIDETGVFENNNYKRHSGPLPDCGCWVLVDVQKDKIVISQDVNGSYGLYLFQSGDGYFAVSNSFFMLLDYVKLLYPLTFNRDYANHLFAADLSSVAYSDTCIDQIMCLDRRAVVEIDKRTKSYSEKLRHLGETEIPVDTDEGIEILDKWYLKWTHILHSIQEKVGGLVSNLSGGFDTRMTFPLLLGSGVDLNAVQVYSMWNNSPVYQDDFKIAQSIAQKFGFALNKVLPAGPTVPYTLEESLQLAFNIKMTFHKKMYFQTFCRTRKRFQMQGMGGELVRYGGRWGKDDMESLAGKYNARLRRHFSSSLAAEFRESFKKVVYRAGQQICDATGIRFDEKLMPKLIYWETRNRWHYGKATLENYFGGTYMLTPLIDPLLQRLKVREELQGIDLNFVPAFIFARYCPDLFDIPFEGGRKMSDKARHYAMEYCRKHPFKKAPEMASPDFIVEASIVSAASKGRVESDVGTVRLTAKDIDHYLSGVLCSEGCRKRILENFNEEIYDFAVGDIEKSGFVTMKEWHGMIGLFVACQDAKFSQIASAASVKSYLDSLCANDGSVRTEIQMPLPNEKQPLVYSFKVNCAQLKISGVLQSADVHEKMDKAAIMLVRFFDAEGNACYDDSLPRSTMFKCGFSYLTCSEGATPFSRVMQIPPEAVRAEICFSRFLNNRKLMLSGVSFNVSSEFRESDC